MNGQLVTVDLDNSSSEENAVVMTIVDPLIAMDKALAKVIAMEKDGISSLDGLDLPWVANQRDRINRLKWPEYMNEDDHYVIDSIFWNGIMTDAAGREYRFIPFSLNIAGMKVGSIRAAIYSDS